MDLMPQYAYMLVNTGIELPSLLLDTFLHRIIEPFCYYRWMTEIYRNSGEDIFDNNL
jgi:hypothetical protein